MPTLYELIASLNDNLRSGELQSSRHWDEPMKQIAALRQCIAAEPDSPQVNARRRRAGGLQQHVALRLEK